MQFKRKLAILAVPAVLALAGGAIAVNAATKPTPTPASSQKETANETGEANQAGEVETADQAGEVDSTNQAGEVETANQTGHSDTGEADHQATGNE